MTIEETNALSEEELEEAKHNWTDEDWWLYYTKDGVMTLEEMREYTKELAIRLNKEKRGTAIYDIREVE